MSRRSQRLDDLAGVILVIASCLVLSLLPMGAVAEAPASGSPSAREAVQRADRKLDGVQRKVIRLERVASRFRIWLRCIRLVPVDEAGDRHHRYGFVYDQRDGTGVHHRQALVRHRGPGRAEYALLSMQRRRACWTAPVTPNGTGDDAKAGATVRTAHPSGPLLRRVRTLERRIVRLERRIGVLERAAGRFDEWESCLSALPLTAQGDPRRMFGHEFRGAGGASFRHTIDIDASEWDDPDYNVLAFVGRQRPFRGRECSTEPGEAPDKSPSTPTKSVAAKRMDGGELHDDAMQLLVDGRELAEDIPDLRVALSEFTSFDQCMYLIGVSNLGSIKARRGYLYQGPRGGVRPRPALAFALDGTVEPRWDLLAFPGEEPPQIECNEDAGGQDTEE